MVLNRNKKKNCTENENENENIIQKMSKINYVVKVKKATFHFLSVLPPSHLNILICHHKFHDAYEGIISTKKDKYIYLVCVP